MRVATYTQPTAVTRSSLAGLIVLVATILVGVSAIPRLVEFFAPQLSALVTFTWLAIYSAAFLGLMVTQGINWISWLVRYRILLVVLMTGVMLSITWAYETQVALERSIHMLGSTIIAIYIGFTVPLFKTLRVLGVVLGICLVASLFTSLFMQDLGIENYEGTRVWRGILNSKNQLGFWSATGVLLYITLSDSVHTTRMRLLCYLMAAVSLVCLVFSHSATSLLVMIVAGALSSYLFLAARFKLGFTQMTVLALMMVGIVALAASNISATELVGRSDDLTGRGEVWEVTWKLIKERPLLGYGYGVLWFPTPELAWIQKTLTSFTWTVYHAHNGFLQVASEIGLPLAVVAMLMVVQQLIEIFYCQYQRQQVGVLFVLAFTVTYLGSNFSEARFLVNRELFWIIFIALPISMLRQINVDAPEQGPAHARPGTRPGSRPGMWETAAANINTGSSAPGQVHASRVGASGPAFGSAPAAAMVAATRSPVPEPAPVHENTGDTQDFDEWTEEDFDSTVSALTLADADIDLGVVSSRSAANDAEAASAEPPSEADIEMNDALDDLFADDAESGAVASAVAGATTDSGEEDPFDRSLNHDAGVADDAEYKDDDKDGRRSGTSGS